MSRKLVIVESPAKVKTIKKYLGEDYEVMASMGHIRDLPQKSLGINVDNNYRPQYINMEGKEKVIRDIREAASRCDGVILATDPDREGEAIAWHLAQLLKLSAEDNNRVTFGEITKFGIETGMASPRTIDENLFNAQQARRILDRLVGYKLSPFLWKKVRRGLSAGRVQSVVVRIIVDREREIKAFVPQEYWSIEAKLLTDKGGSFSAKLRTRDGIAPEDFRIADASECEKIVKFLKGSEYTIDSIKKGTRKRQPEPPFITSTMQQDASRKLGFTSKRTMRTAQDLYEGIELPGEGQVGLITYMRTDSLRVSAEAVDAANNYIKSNYGEKYIYDGDRKGKAKKGTQVQDAHEAIRPTMIDLTPEKAKDALTPDQYKLYKLIWERFIASRMADQIQETVTVDVRAGEYQFRATGYTVLFDGFAKVYEVATDEKKEQATVLPEISDSSKLKLEELVDTQKFTQPPQRYNEASLIKVLEENGIGRPSTYAPTISTIIDRAYVERDGRTLVPTSLGIVVTDLMIDNFPEIVDEKFTADMEEKLDMVGGGKENWVDTVDGFYRNFAKDISKAEEAMEGVRVEVPVEETDVVCEKCGRKMVIKKGRFGKFLACPGYPECTNTKRIVIETPGACPKCGKTMEKKKSAKGRIYYACTGGKACGFMSWNEPVDKNCPKCSSKLFKKKGKNGMLICEKEGCGYTEAVTE